MARQPEPPSVEQQLREIVLMRQAAENRITNALTIAYEAILQSNAYKARADLLLDRLKSGS